MRSFPATPKDNRVNIGRFEFTGYDMDVIEESIPRIEALRAFEAELCVSPVDRTTITELLEILTALRNGWESDKPVLTHSSMPDVQSAFD